MNREITIKEEKIMKKWEEMTFEEREEITLLFSNWLRKYSDTVIMEVLKLRDQIIEDEYAMRLLKELSEREAEEYKDFSHSIGSILRDYKTFSKYDPHNHPLTHASSYRDVLYDMFIK